jgi:hypothetical protein
MVIMVVFNIFDAQLEQFVSEIVYSNLIDDDLIDIG